MTQTLCPTREDLTELLTDRGVTTMHQAVPSFPLVACLQGSQVVALVGLDAFYSDDGELIAKVSRALEWYQRTFTGDQYDPALLGQLIGTQGYLARAREEIGRLVGKAQAQAKAAEYRRRSYRDTLMLTYRRGGDAVGVAQAKARTETVKLDEEHTDAIEYHTRLRAIQDSMDATLMAIAQERKRMSADYERAHLTG